ncbi:MAG: hypothetical protein AAGG75_13120 [Bacteroidota bacterium]
MIEEKKSQLKNLLIDDLEKGIEELLQLLDTDSPMMNQVILLSSRHERLQADDRMGILSTEERYLGLNRIRMAYLSLVDDLEEEDFKVQHPSATPSLDMDFYRQSCQDFLQIFQHQMDEQASYFQTTYTQTGTLLVDFGQLFMSIGQLISSLKIEPEKEEEYHRKLQAAMSKSTRRLRLFEQQLGPALVHIKKANQQLIDSYQQLINYLDFPNESTKAGGCQQQFKQQLQRLNNLKNRSARLHQELNFIAQLEAMAYVFKLNDELNLAFTKTLEQLKILEAESRTLNESAESLSAQLEISIEEMLM